MAPVDCAVDHRLRPERSAAARACKGVGSRPAVRL